MIVYSTNLQRQQSLTVYKYVCTWLYMVLTYRDNSHSLHINMCVYMIVYSTNLQRQQSLTVYKYVYMIVYSTNLQRQQSLTVYKYVCVYDCI
jgi:hypothetical protein